MVGEAGHKDPGHLRVLLRERSLHPHQVSSETLFYLLNFNKILSSRVHTVVVSCQHSEKVTLEALRKDIMEKVVLTTIPKQYITPETKYHINPCGNFVIGGNKI